MVIAVDGPAASGKGTIAKALARHYRLPHLDTGLLYRAVAATVLDHELDPENEADAVASCGFDDLLLGAASQSPRSERIAIQLATCADDFLGAVLRDWVRIDPATDATEPPSRELRRLVLEQLRSAQDDAMPLSPAPHSLPPPARARAALASAHN